MSVDNDLVWTALREMRWFERGDADGFFRLALDNLVQLILIVTLCQGVLGLSPARV